MPLQHGQALKGEKESLRDFIRGQTFPTVLKIKKRNLKVIIFLLPDARCGIKASRSQVIPTGRPRQLSHGALVAVLQHALTDPRVTCKYNTVLDNVSNKVHKHEEQKIAHECGTPI